MEDQNQNQPTTRFPEVESNIVKELYPFNCGKFYCVLTVTRNSTIKKTSFNLRVQSTAGGPSMPLEFESGWHEFKALRGPATHQQESEPDLHEAIRYHRHILRALLARDEIRGNGPFVSPATPEGKEVGDVR